MTTCTIGDCEKPSRKRSWCDMHYARWRKHGDPAYQRPKPDCSIEDCTKQAIARGWCATHYWRWQRHGDPLGGNERFATPEEAFLARTEPLVWSSCIVWTGATNRHGYGQLQVNGRMVYAHRYSWERTNGTIPDDRILDHACWERSCVNPEHLRLATISQNSAYLSGARKGRKHDLPRGVTRRGRGYEAAVQSGGIRHYLGTFSTPEEASAAAEAKRAILFGAFAGRA